MACVCVCMCSSLLTPFYVLLLNKPGSLPGTQRVRERSRSGLGSLWSRQENNPTFILLSSLFLEDLTVSFHVFPPLTISCSCRRGGVFTWCC